MSKCECNYATYSMFPLMLSMLLLVIVLNSDDNTPLTADEKFARDKAWNEGVHNFVIATQNYYFAIIGFIALSAYLLFNSGYRQGAIMLGLFAGVVFMWGSPDICLSCNMPPFQITDNIISGEKIIDIEAPITESTSHLQILGRMK